jgi:hypothetical protein
MPLLVAVVLKLQALLLSETGLSDGKVANLLHPGSSSSF